MATLSLDQLVASVKELPPLPATAVRLMEMTSDSTASARDIGDLIGSDVAMTTRVLRIANSAFYGMPRSVQTVRDAVLILGMRAVRSLAIAAAASDTLQMESAGYRMGQGELWKHSLHTAMLAQMVASRTGAAPGDEAFVAGLLHDVGKVVLSVYVSAQFDAIEALAELDGIQFTQAERGVLGFDHAEVGARVADRWNLPQVLCEAVGGHHGPFDGGKDESLAVVVHLANVLAGDERLGRRAPYATALDPAAGERLGLTSQDHEDLIAEAAANAANAGSLFGLAAQAA
ncbi:MAG TPA: HDOD domain-containing protein [Chthonomonadales bacterium]|nr:HDOD domain-containing protein [Chthonomonadales bacterium]